MIIFLCTADHAYTVRAVIKCSSELKIRVESYAWLFGQQPLPPATYIFTDMDRLGPRQLRQAARVYRRLRARGDTVINDPARSLSRHGLLSRLHADGLNSFESYRVEDGVRPRRWPVFLRAEGDHDPPLSGLLDDWSDAQAAIEKAVDDGFPITQLILIEYAAEPAAPGLFRKLSVFRIGESYFAANCVHEDNWMVKYGTQGIATEALYEDELRIMRTNPFAAALRPAFERAGIEYGRADFGLVNGRVQIYEINSNPTVAFPTDHPFPARPEGYRIFRENYFRALAAISPEIGRPEAGN